MTPHMIGVRDGATPPVHAKLLGRNKFGKMLNAVYHNIGPHRNSAGTISGLYLLRWATMGGNEPEK